MTDPPSLSPQAVFLALQLSIWPPNWSLPGAGKIMRRILRKIAANKLDELGDTSTLADPAVVQVRFKPKLGCWARSSS